jgi:hypothetical protein
MAPAAAGDLVIQLGAAFGAAASFQSESELCGRTAFHGNTQAKTGQKLKG